VESAVPRRPDLATVLRTIDRRWQDYAQATIDDTISPDDDMLPGTQKREGYRAIGLSALEVITEAMVLARRTDFTRILDMPCGGGRVTRHLVKFFPEADIAVSDVEKRKQAFVVSQFGAKGIDIPQDFSRPSPQSYDLIFVGSLVTHLDEDMFRRTLTYCIDALAPAGVLVMTTHGRHRAYTALRNGGPRLAAAIANGFLGGGFGYVEIEHDRQRYGASYGTSFSAPAWVLALMQRRSDATILGFKEQAWANDQDVVIVQKTQRDVPRGGKPKG
jgi:SAM-dependent methyltransferase